METQIFPHEKNYNLPKKKSSKKENPKSKILQDIITLL
jgi:hypothetical protein